MRTLYQRFFTDYLWLAVIISLLIHGALVYTAARHSPPPAHQAEPDISLINYQNEEQALDALLLAQWEAAGGGEADFNEAASAPFSGPSTPSPNELVLQALKKELRELEKQKYDRIQQLESQWQTVQAQLENSRADLDNTTQEQLQTQSLQLTKELHVLKEQLTEHNAKPRIHFDAPSAKASAFASYIENWRAKIERLGTEHYPEQARGQLSDKLQLTVYINKDGQLLKIEINQAAENPVFTVAAQRIVRLAAPFGPFSSEMREKTDVLAITRSWHFTQGQLNTR